MRFVTPFTADYDPDAKTFTFAGSTADGGQGEAVIPLKTPEQFLIWIAACLREKAAMVGSLEGTQFTTRLHMEMQALDGSATALIVQVEFAGVPLSFALLLRGMSTEELQTIKAHLEAALAMIFEASSPRSN